MVQRASSSLRKSAPARGFTLVELLVVIAIIAILIGLTVVIAGKVGGSGKAKKTEQTLRALDAMLAAYTHSKGGIPPPTVLDPRPQAANTKSIIPIVDGRNGLAEYMNTVGLFMLQCREVPEADAMIKGLDAKIVHEYDPDGLDAGAPNFAKQPSLPTAFDGWGNPIRYVHPVFKGVIVADITAGDVQPQAVSAILGPPPPGKFYGISSVRRATDYVGGVAPVPPVTPLMASSTPFDSDCGIPSDARPYFYSCGPDGDPRTVEDNIYYPVRPKFPKK